jgi:glutaredoxin 2
MLKRKRTKKVNSKKKVNTIITSGTKVLLCSSCLVSKIKTDINTVSLVCGRCVAIQANTAENEVESIPNKPRGWHFKKVFEFNGSVYSYGKEISDKTIIAQLKNDSDEVLPPTVVDRKPAKKRGRKNASNT